MKRILVCGLLCSLLGGLAYGFELPGRRQTPLQAGVAVTDITPPVGWRMSGYFNERPSTAVHDPLQAKALVLRQGKMALALVLCDLIGISPELADQVRQEASLKTGIPYHFILVAATHTHTGPLYHGALRDHLHAQAVAKHGKDPLEWVDYPGILADRLVEVIAQAYRDAEPVRLDVGGTQVSGLSFNRRFHMRDGTVVFNPGKKNPDIVRPAGPVDTQLLGLMVTREEDKRALAAMACFPLHLDTIGGTAYSADYPLYLERGLRRVTTTNLVVLFGNGACGDINHINVSDARPQGGFAEAERIGATLAGAMIGAFSKFETIRKPALAARSRRISVPLQECTPEQISQARERLPLVGTDKLSFLDQVRAVKTMELQSFKSPDVTLEVQAFRLGPEAAIVGLPGEVFTELGTAIKQASPFKYTFVIELCNDVMNYIPTKKAFAEGSYETVNSLVKPGAGEQLVETALALLRELQEKP